MACVRISRIAERTVRTMTNEQKKHIDAFEYWVKTNTENGVSIIPESICKDIIAILREREVKTE